jgi:hypothetical protein
METQQGMNNWYFMARWPCNLKLNHLAFFAVVSLNERGCCRGGLGTRYRLTQADLMDWHSLS